MPSGDGNVLTVHTNDGTERFRIDSSGNVKVGSAATISPDGDLFVTGVCTATTLSGAASGLTGALPAIDGSALTGIAATDNVRTGILDVAGIATFRNDVNIGAAVTISESGIEASGIGITCASINGAQIGGRRNLIINGAMNVAQRGTSSTGNGYQTVDRFKIDNSGTDEAPTQAQVDLSSSDTPYTFGFRKSVKITNGNQTSGAGAADYIGIEQRIEAQNIATSGWNYASPTSFVTFSFWVKSSVAQNFYGYLFTEDGAERVYSFETGSLTADTWTKITKTIPGNSIVQVNNDNGFGLQIQLWPYLGTNYTASGATLNQWKAWDGADRFPDMTTTWYTTNDATFETTGWQLEVGPQATPFEHRSFGEELTLCQRYYYKSTQYGYPVQNPIATSQVVDNDGFLGWAFYATTQCRSFQFQHPVEMRASPTVNFYSSARVSSPDDGKMAVYSGAWYNLTSQTAQTNTRRLGIKGVYSSGLTVGNTYLIGGGFECGAEL